VKEYTTKEILHMSIPELEVFADEISGFDKYSLDDEAVSQSRLVGILAPVFAKAKNDYAIAKKAFERLEGKKTLDIRRNYKEYGFEFKDELKEKAIQAVIDDLEEIREAYNEFLSILHRLNIIEGLVGSMDHRKTMLRLAGDLYIREYYTRDSISIHEQDNLRERLGSRKRR
jgi:hypothetical protein